MEHCTASPALWRTCPRGAEGGALPRGVASAPPVHLWFASVDHGPAEPSLLCADEQQRLARFVAPHAAREFLVGRTLLRTALSALIPHVEPGDWRFRFNSHGRPEVAPIPGVPTPVFSLAHSRGLAVTAVTWNCELGIDVERLDRFPPIHTVGPQVFSPGEMDAIKALSEPEQPRRFWDCWTLKEALSKALGLGLAFPVEKCQFRPTPDGPRVQFLPPLTDTPDRWNFAQWVHEGWLISLALAGPALEFHWHTPPRPPGDRMQRAQILEALKTNLFNIVEASRGKDIVETASMKDYGADSLEMVEVVSRTMKQLKVKVPRTELATAKNLGQVLDLFEKHAPQG